MKNKSILDKYKGLSFAEVAKKLDKKYKYREVDNQQMSAYKAELSQLQKAQDAQRLAIEAAQQFKNGGKLPTYENGGLFGDNPLTINNSQPGQISYPNLWATPTDSGLQPLPLLPLTNPMQTPTGAQVGPPAPFRGQVNVNAPLDDRTGTNIPLTINNNFGMSTPQDAPKPPADDNVFTPALIGKALETGINLSQLVGGAQKFTPIENPNANRVERLMAERSIDNTAIRNELLSQFNAARANNQRARSANVANALDANLAAGAQQAMSNASFQEQQMNLGLQADYATTLNNLGQQSVQAQERSRMLNAQSQGNFQTELSKFGMSLADTGKFLSDVKTNKQNQMTIANILNTRYSQFGIDQSVTDRLLSGKMTNDDIIKLNNAVGTQAAEALIEAFKYNTPE